MLELWMRVDAGKISAAEVRLHLGIARVILDTLKVEMMAAHLNQTHIPAVPVKPRLLKAASSEH
jgi:hypothetical protein